MPRRVRVAPGQDFRFPSGSHLTRENELVLPDLEADDPAVQAAIAAGTLIDVGPMDGPTSGYSIQAIVSGPLAVADNVIRPGLRVVANGVVNGLAVSLAEAPTGAPAVFQVERYSGGVSAGIVGTVTVPAGTIEGTVTGLNVNVLKGDLLRVNITGVGTTTPGADANVAADFTAS